MIFSWLKNRRRRQLLRQPFPITWLEYLQRNVAQYSLLTEAEQTKLRDLLRIFVMEKHWEGCGGLSMTAEIQVTIAAQACLLVLELGLQEYDRLRSILVYPAGYLATPPSEWSSTLVVDEGSPRSGEAWYRGPVILSWSEVLTTGRSLGQQNLVFHEFAHQLDMLDGLVDGTPPLETREHRRRWHTVMNAEYMRLVENSERGHATLLDYYGTKNEGEFFAVATESFFQQPIELARQHPGLYQILREYYRQDPAERIRQQR